MKKLIFSSLVGLALVAFTGCTTGNDAKAGAKCSTSKCSTIKKNKCSSSKCSSSKVSKKCASSGKCGK